MSEIRDLHEPLTRWLSTQPVVYRRSRSDRATSEICGEPDFSIFADHRALFIEFKAKDGRISAAQSKRHAAYADAGCRVHVCRSLNAATELISAWLSQTPIADPQQPDRAQEPELRRFAGGVWRDDGSGFTRIRTATAADAGIPELKR